MRTIRRIFGIFCLRLILNYIRTDNGNIIIRQTTDLRCHVFYMTNVWKYFYYTSCIVFACCHQQQSKYKPAGAQ